MALGNRDGDWDRYTIRPDGTGLKRLTRTPGNDAHAAWSADGRWLAFSSARGGFKDEMARGGGGQPATDIFVMRADGSDVRRLTDDAAEEGTVAFAEIGPSAIRHPLFTVTVENDATSGQGHDVASSSRDRPKCLVANARPYLERADALLNLHIGPTSLAQFLASFVETPPHVDLFAFGSATRACLAVAHPKGERRLAGCSDDFRNWLVRAP